MACTKSYWFLCETKFDLYFSVKQNLLLEMFKADEAYKTQKKIVRPNYSHDNTVFFIVRKLILLPSLPFFYFLWDMLEWILLAGFMKFCYFQ